MSEPTAFWQRVDELLDRRRDPLDDAEVQEHLLAHPEDGQALARLRASLRACERLPRESAARARRLAAVAPESMGLIWVAGSVAAVVLAAWIWHGRLVRPVESWDARPPLAVAAAPAAPAAQPAPAPAVRVLACRVTLAREERGVLRTETFDAFGSRVTYAALDVGAVSPELPKIQLAQCSLTRTRIGHQP